MREVIGKNQDLERQNQALKEEVVVQAPSERSSIEFDPNVEQVQELVINNEENQKLKDLLVVEEKQTQDYKESLKRVSEILMKTTNSCSNLEIEVTGLKDRNDEYKLTISDL